MVMRSTTLLIWNGIVGMAYNGMGINEVGMVNGAMSRKVEITLNSAVSLVQTVQPLLFIPCYKYVVVWRKEVSLLNRWCGWNRLPAPTSPTITYNEWLYVFGFATHILRSKHKSQLAKLTYTTC